MTVCVLFCDGVLIGIFESWALASQRVDYERKIAGNDGSKYEIQRWIVMEDDPKK